MKSNLSRCVLLQSYSALVVFSPDPDVAWSLQDRSLPIGRHKILNSKTELVLTNVHRSDEGVYVCRGSNSAGYSDQTVYLEVNGM